MFTFTELDIRCRNKPDNTERCLITAVRVLAKHLGQDPEETYNGIVTTARLDTTYQNALTVEEVPEMDHGVEVLENVIGAKAVKALTSAGYTTINSLKETDPDDLEMIIGIGKTTVAKIKSWLMENA